MNALIIFIKNPVPGKVKTRLAKDVGDKQALLIYHSLLDYTKSIASFINAKRYLFYSDVIIEDKWSPTQFTKKVQSGNDLGERMSNAFTKVLKHHPKALIIGSDCPELDFITISQAFETLDNHDYVIGPSLDGGYYLLGMKALNADVFDDITWSTDTVLTQTIKKIEDSNRTCGLLPKLSDVDYKEDWEKYGWDL